VNEPKHSCAPRRWLRWVVPAAVPVVGGVWHVTSGIVSALDRTVEVPGENNRSALLVSPWPVTVTLAAQP